MVNAPICLPKVKLTVKLTARKKERYCNQHSSVYQISLMAMVSTQYRMCLRFALLNIKKFKPLISSAAWAYCLWEIFVSDFV